MGHFLAVSAFNIEKVDDILKAICDYLTAHKAPAQRRMLPVNPDDHIDVVVYEPHGGWCVVHWPNHFISNDFPLVRAVSDTISRPVSSVHVYDSDYWEHLFRKDTRDVHLFCSRPSYWKDDDADATEKMLAYNSDPSELCAILGKEKSAVAPYLIDVDKQESPGKAFEDDQFPLDNIWVFVDFWRRLGISYPERLDKNHAAVLRLPSNFSEILPYE